jgi:hypothetical protein
MTKDTFGFRSDGKQVHHRRETPLLRTEVIGSATTSLISTRRAQSPRCFARVADLHRHRRLIDA